VPIKPPDKLLPDIDKQVAELFGITERMVRRCRTDPKLQQFMPHPVWLERDWLKQERLIFEARQVAKRLMTPERYAKQEPIGLVNGSIKVFDTIDLLPISGSGRHALWTFRSSAQNAGIPFKTGTEIEVIPGAGPRHRVGCEDFSIGGPPIRNVVHRIDRLGSWRALRDQWRSHRADYRRDRCTHSEFWSAAEQAWPRWEAVDPQGDALGHPGQNGG
jgi:hypothetical protein